MCATRLFWSKSVLSWDFMLKIPEKRANNVPWVIWFSCVPVGMLNYLLLVTVILAAIYVVQVLCQFHVLHSWTEYDRWLQNSKTIWVQRSLSHGSWGLSGLLPFRLVPVDWASLCTAYLAWFVCVCLFEGEQDHSCEWVIALCHDDSVLSLCATQRRKTVGWLKVQRRGRVETDSCSVEILRTDWNRVHVGCRWCKYQFVFLVEAGNQWKRVRLQLSPATCQSALGQDSKPVDTAACQCVDLFRWIENTTQVQSIWSYRAD